MLFCICILCVCLYCHNVNRLPFNQTKPKNIKSIEQKLGDHNGGHYKVEYKPKITKKLFTITTTKGEPTVIDNINFCINHTNINVDDNIKSEIENKDKNIESNKINETKNECELNGDSLKEVNNIIRVSQSDTNSFRIDLSHVRNESSHTLSDYNL